MLFDFVLKETTTKKLYIFSSSRLIDEILLLYPPLYDSDTQCIILKTRLQRNATVRPPQVAFVPPRLLNVSNVPPKSIH